MAKTTGQLDSEINESLRGPERALRLLKNAVQYLYDSDFELVEGGCADVSEILAAFAKNKGFDVEVVYGEAIVGGEVYHHAWLTVYGKRFDPTWWVQQLRGGTYREDPLAKHRICSLIEATGVGLDHYVSELERNVRAPS
jgi:hypothetical protein